MVQMNHNKKKLIKYLENLGTIISQDHIKTFIKYSDRDGLFKPRYLQYIENDLELKEEILLYWEEHIGWLDDDLFNQLLENNTPELFLIKCQVYFFKYQYQDLICGNILCNNFVKIKNNIPLEYCCTQCLKKDEGK
jgi:hypothetical protein